MNTSSATDRRTLTYSSLWSTLQSNLGSDVWEEITVLCKHLSKIAAEKNLNGEAELLCVASIFDEVADLIHSPDMEEYSAKELARALILFTKATFPPKEQFTQSLSKALFQGVEFDLKKLNCKLSTQGRIVSDAISEMDQTALNKAVLSQVSKHLLVMLTNKLKSEHLREDLTVNISVEDAFKSFDLLIAEDKPCNPTQ